MTDRDQAARIEPRRVLCAGAKFDFIHCVRLDERKLSLKTFESYIGADESADEFLPGPEVKALIGERTPHGIVYSSALAGRLVHGADLHPSLQGEHLHGIGEYCLDLDDPGACSPAATRDRCSPSPPPSATTASSPPTPTPTPIPTRPPADATRTGAAGSWCARSTSPSPTRA